MPCLIERNMLKDTIKSNDIVQTQQQINWLLIFYWEESPTFLLVFHLLYKSRVMFNYISALLYEGHQLISMTIAWQ